MGQLGLHVHRGARLFASKDIVGPHRWDEERKSLLRRRRAQVMIAPPLGLLSDLGSLQLVPTVSSHYGDRVVCGYDDELVTHSSRACGLR